MIESLMDAPKDVKMQLVMDVCAAPLVSHQPRIFSTHTSQFIR
jgi:hypothetical protein